MYKIFFLTLFIPIIGLAQAGAKSKRFLIEVNSMFGWGSAQRAGDAAVPSIGTFDLGIGLGINIKKITVGISYDYRILTQHSDVNSSVGNRRGNFTSPTSLLFRVNFEKIRMGFLLINNGSYELTNLDVNGKKIIYTKPSGFRFDLIFRQMKKITPFLFFESVSFSGMQLDGIDSALSSNLSYSNNGVGIKYEF